MMRSRVNGPRRAAGATLTIGVTVTVLVIAASLAERNGTLPGPLPLFPADNWWNQDISQAPVDPRSAQYIAFIGATDGLHPDFGGTASPGSHDIYGMPYVVVGADQPKVAVEFDYADESDGVNHQTGQSYPFYPIPPQAITEPYWIEGGPPGQVNVGGDRHMLIVDRDNRHLYELFALRWTGGRWEAGSGAFFDLDTNARRPEGWTSADAAGLAILPGLVRYDEVFGPDEIRHAFRVTVHGVNGYVWPASHRANTNSAGPPLGTRLRLKASVNISGYPPYIQKIFRAMKTYGLIVADTGSDMYVSGVFDTRWNNGQLNPAFRAVKAGDFEVIELGWRGNTGPCERPGVPVSFSGVGAGLGASFSWAAPASGGLVSDYLLEAGTSPGASDAATVTLPSTATSFSATGAPGTYYVRLRARNACGHAATDDVAITLASSCVLPTAPGQPTAAVSGSAVAVSWTPASGASAHVFEAGSLPGTANLLSVAVAGSSINANAPPGVYFVRARGQNACGAGPASPDALIAVGCSAPGAASPLTASVAGGEVTLQWHPAAGAVDYLVEAGTASGAGNIASIPQTGTSLVAQAPPGRYFVRVRPRNACGSGWWSNEVVVTVP
jgi:hypothetical protein